VLGGLGNLPPVVSWGPSGSEKRHSRLIVGCEWHALCFDGAGDSCFRNIRTRSGGKNIDFAVHEASLMDVSHEGLCLRDGVNPLQKEAYGGSRLFCIVAAALGQLLSKNESNGRKNALHLYVNH